MSTRRIKVEGREYRFDHGAQFFTAREKAFQSLLEAFLEQGLIKEWHSEIPHEAYTERQHSRRYCGTKGMNALVKAFSKDIKSKFGWECQKISFQKNYWRLSSKKGEELQAKTLVLSCPLPQSLRLLSDIKVDTKELSDIRYFPVWAVLLGAKEEFKLPAPHARWLDPGTGIEWACDNQRKGVSSEPSLTIHLTEEKSLEFLEAKPEAVIRFAKEKLAHLLPKEISLEMAHRWLYSRAGNEAHEPPFFYSDKPGPLYLIGDAFGGGRVEGAALSGLTASQRLLQSNRSLRL